MAHAGPEISPAGLTWPFENAATIPIDLPTCLEDGEYLLRIEHIALHSASSPGGAQLYISCAQLNVSGGSGAISAPQMLSFPGSYSPTDPGLMINIYCGFLLLESQSGGSETANTETRSHTDQLLDARRGAGCHLLKGRKGTAWGVYNKGFPWVLGQHKMLNILFETERGRRQFLVSRTPNRCSVLV